VKCAVQCTVFCCWCAGIFLLYVCKETKTSIIAVLIERYGFILSEVFKQYVAKFSLVCFIGSCFFCKFV
jgi:hypothetical protein